MSSNLHVSITGRLAADPVPRATTGGKMVTNFTVITNDRRFDRDRNEWVDANKTAIRVSCWEDLAETAGNCLFKGDLVTVTGHRLLANPYLDKEGKPNAGLELTADTISAELKGQHVKITRLQRTPASTQNGTEPPF
ncbi:single-stranded DNA-binding protein [Nocardia sp. NPDC056000]|uniref:single-stranded DNA-binding protein n=1 Tax=Nocardia sp. NPDC056000 TaxID=3345674 RepID=UPI0035E227BD